MKSRVYLVPLLSFVVGVLVTVVAIAAGTQWLSPEADVPLSKRWSIPSTPGRNLTFGPTKAQEVLGELTIEEIKNTATWFLKRTRADKVRTPSKNSMWLAGPSAVELLRPPKIEVLAYISGQGPKPQRFARLTSVGPKGVMEYRAGPLVNGSPVVNAELTPLFKEDTIPYTKRPTEPGADIRLAEGLVNASYIQLEPLLTKTFGNIFPQLDGFDPSKGQITYFFRNNALVPKGTRNDLVKVLWQPPAPLNLETIWMHPVPIDLMLNTTDKDPSKWHLLFVKYCKQKEHATIEGLLAAYHRGEVRVCPFDTKTGPFDVPTNESPPSPLPQKVEKDGGVSWGPWAFTVTQRPSTGPALVDVTFNGERVLYELAMSDAQAPYSGEKDTSFFYSDAAWTLSMLSTNLKPGVDCPEGAHYMKVPNWYQLLPGGAAETDATKPYEFMPICIFEWDEDHTIWRHMENSVPPHVKGLVRKTVVIRSIATVANYDYITDIKLREDGEIEVHTRFAGYIESRYYSSDFNPEEANFSTIIRKNLAGPVHSHLVAWKADIDVAGVRTNAFRKTRVSTMPIKGPYPDQKLVSKFLEITEVQREGSEESTCVADPHHPSVWTIVDRAATNTDTGNPRGYAVTLGTFSTLQVLPDWHPFTRAMPFTKYHLAVTKYHDNEYRVNSPYVQYDAYAPDGSGQNLDKFLSDGESLVDEDLVAWIGLGKEHIVRQEDQPLVSNFGVGFSLQPWNFFDVNVAASPLNQPLQQQQQA